MTAPWKIVGFMLGLAVVFAAAAWLGATLGPDGGASPQHSGTNAAPAVGAYRLFLDVKHQGVRTAEFTVWVDQRGPAASAPATTELATGGH